MKSNNIVIIIIAALVLYAATVSTINLVKHKKIAYIESGKMMEKYPTAVKARAELTKKTDEWKKNISTLEAELTEMNKVMMEQGTQWDKQKLLNKQEEFNKKQQDYARYTRAISEKAQQKEQEIFTPVYNEINANLKKFGEKKGYSIIFGTLSGGNILYANDGEDITEEFINYVKELE